MKRFAVVLGLWGCDDLCERCSRPRPADRCLDLSLELPAGPSSPFPLLVGNWWRYQVWARVNGTLVKAEPKTYVVEANDGAGNVRMAVEGETAGARFMKVEKGGIFWVERTRTVSGRKITYEPPATRLDLSPGRSCVGDRWPRTFVETQEQPGMPTMVTQAAERWEVVDVHRSISNEFWGHPLDAYCVVRITEPALEDVGGTGIFCFAYGLGKFYENTESEEEKLERACVNQDSCCASAETPSGVPRQMCAGECVDTMQDPGHCGGCDHACVEGVPCVLGQCVAAG